MFDYVPDFLRPETAATEAEADAWCEHHHVNRRPPELLPPDIVARAIDAEVRAGRGTTGGGVFLELTSSAAYALNQLLTLKFSLKKLCDIDIMLAAIEVAPACHSVLGGVRIEAETTASTVPGLFAAGEVAAGLHGAARLGGNGLSEALVFGRRAGLHAAQFSMSVTTPSSIDGRDVEACARALIAPLRRASGENPFELQRELQECMHRHVGVGRTGEELGRALETIADLRKRSCNVAVGGGRAYNPGWHLALDLQSLLCVSEATALAATERKESRGCHLRQDFPGPDARYTGTSIVVAKSKHGLVVSRRPLPQMPMELKRLVHWSKKWLAKKPVSKSGVVMPAVAGSKNIA
jgi:succinate dehydrogenase / fumarate reductase flavoprotein subunit